MPPTDARAVVFRGEHRLAVERRPRPDPGPHEVRLRVEACGICGSDLHLFQNGLYAPGLVPGHEFAGSVDALGPEVEGISVGQRMAVEPFRSCGRCDCCRRGRDPLCRAARVLGLNDPGGLAEFVIVPARRLFRVPPDLDASLAALAEPMAVAVHALRRGGLAPGQRVLVLGAGSIGLLTLVAARTLGAGEVWLTARHPHQAELAHALGAHQVLGEDAAAPAALSGLGGEVPFDLVVESVGGQATTLEAAGAAVRPGGVVSVVGLFLGRVEIDSLPLLLKEATLAWSYCYARGEGDADFAAAVRILDGERAGLDALVTHRVPLDQVARAYVTAAERRAGALKVSVLPC